MTDHTPGPWFVSRGGQGEPFAVEASTRTVALVKTCRQQTEANARLIAAAPELLAALEYALEFLTANDDGEEDVVDRIASAKTAIAKAKGETP